MYFHCTRFAESAGAGFQSGAGGQHIINHNYRFTVETPVGFDGAG